MNKFRYNKINIALSMILSSMMVSTAAYSADENSSTSESNNNQAQNKTNSKVQTETIVVMGDKEKGTTFRPKSVTMGPLGEQNLHDLPYAATVFNQDMLEDRQITGLDGVLKYDSSAQMEARGGMDVGRPQTRGVEGSVVANTHLDGMNVVATTAQPIELYQRVEVIHSLTGALYGPATPAGNFNYEFKRPTLDYLNNVNVGLDSNGARKLALDLGGTPYQHLGYRINLIKEQGAGYVSGSQIDRKAVGLAFDIYATDQTTIELNGSYYRYKKYGFPGSFSYTVSSGLPSAVDPTKRGYGQSFAGSDLETTTGSFKVKHDINDTWKFEAGMLGQKVDRTMTSPTNTINGDGTFTQTVSTQKVARRFKLISNEARFNGNFSTAGIDHQMTVGTTGYDWKNYSVTGNSGVSRYTLGSNIDLDDPQQADSPTFYTDGDYSLASKTITQSGILGDLIQFNDQWSMLLVGSYSHFDTLNSSSSDYHDDGVSSTESVMYKPFTDTMTYVAYSDTLEAGQVVTDTDYDNYGETLAPYRSRQIETGVKQSFAGMDANLALFRIKRPLAYASNNVYQVQGMQRNYGLELGLNGNVTSQVKVMANGTWLDATLTDAYSESAENKRVVGVPRFQANLLAEYDFIDLPGFSVNANVHYVGKRAADADNDIWVSAYTTLDLGAKYITRRFYGKKMTVRLNVTNVTNERYWASVFPSTIYGNASSGGSAFLGDPLQANLTTSIEF